MYEMCKIPNSNILCNITVMKISNWHHIKVMTCSLWVYLVFGVAQHALQGPICGLLHGLLDLAVGCGPGQTARQVHHGHVRHWHPERHAGQLPATTTVTRVRGQQSPAVPSQKAGGQQVHK